MPPVTPGDQQSSPGSSLSPQPTPFSPQEAPPASPTPEQKPNSKKRFLTFGIFLILLIGALVGGFFVLNKAEKLSEGTHDANKDIPVFKVGLFEADLTGFYPNTVANASDIDVNTQIFEGLVGYSDLTKIEPLLATSWANPNETTWVFTIKPNVTFHTGRTMTAQDVKASLDAAKDSPLASFFSSSIKEVSVVGDDKVQIITDGPDPLLLNRLAFMFIYDTTSTTPNSPLNGTGPYTLKEGTSPSKETVQLVAYDKYHRGRPSTRELHYLTYDTEDNLLNDVISKEVSLGGYFTNERLTKAREAAAETFTQETTSVYHLGLNKQKNGPLQKLAVRKAIYAATDPETFMKARGAEGVSASQIVTQEIPGFNPTIKRPEYNTATAKQLLSEAGYPNGLSLGLIYFAPAEDAAIEVKRQLGLAGITVNLEKIDEGQVMQQRTDTAQFDMFFGGYSTDLLDLSDVVASRFQSKFYQSPAIDQKLLSASTILDRASRLQVLQDISKDLMDDVAWIPIYSPRFTYALSDAYVLTRDMPGISLGIFFWKAHLK